MFCSDLAILIAHHYFRIITRKKTVTDAQFIAYFRRGYFQPGKLIDWLLGKRVLQDRRCLWIELSMPKDSSGAQADLRAAWQTIVPYWQAHFPPLWVSPVR